MLLVCFQKQLRHRHLQSSCNELRQSQCGWILTCYDPTITLPEPLTQNAIVTSSICCILSRESLYKPSFSTIASWLRGRFQHILPSRPVKACRPVSQQSISGPTDQPPLPISGHNKMTSKPSPPTRWNNSLQLTWISLLRGKAWEVTSLSFWVGR